MPAELSQGNITEFSVFAGRLADAAAAVTLAQFRSKFTVDNKKTDGDFDPVTEADREAERAMRQLIEQHYPDHAIHGEEYGVKDTASVWQWVLDPIDGTRAFMAGLPTWGTLIALTFNGEPVIGLIDQPYLQERFLGTPGSTTLNGEPVRTRRCPSLAEAILSTTDPGLFVGREASAFEHLRQSCRLVRYGLDCYAYAVLAAGHIDLVAESGLKFHDIMALVPVIRGAGGLALSWRGSEPGPEGTLLAVGDPSLVESALTIIDGGKNLESG